MMTTMRTIIDLPPDQLDALDRWCRREGISRAEAIRRAVADRVRPERAADRDRAFGIWRDRAIDGLAYQRRARGEWDRQTGSTRRRSR